MTQPPTNFAELSDEKKKEATEKLTEIFRTAQAQAGVGQKPQSILKMLEDLSVPMQIVKDGDKEYLQVDMNELMAAEYKHMSGFDLKKFIQENGKK